MSDLRSSMRPVEPGDYSFCEGAWAGPKSPWHIRRLTSVGKKLGGGIDTASLCGRVGPPAVNGWDLEVQISDHHLGHACKTCVAVYRSQAKDIK